MAYASLRYNLIADPRGLGGGGSWFGNGATISVDTTHLPPGATTTYKFVGANTVAAPYTGYIAVTPGLPYTLSNWTTIPTGLSQNLLLFTFYYNSSFVNIAQSFGPYITAGTTIANQRQSMTSTAPAGAAWALVGYFFPSGNPTPSDVIWAGNWMFEQSAVLGTYFDGSMAWTSLDQYGWTATANSSPSYDAVLYSAVPQPTDFYGGQEPFTYYFVIYDSLTGNALGTLQSFSQVQLTLGLNGVDNLQFTVQTKDPNCTIAMLSTLSREIGVFRSNGPGTTPVPLFVGPIVHVTPSFKNRTVQIQCNSVWWYMQKRTNELTYDFSNSGLGTELGTIAWQVLNDALGKVPGGNIRLSKSPSYPTNTGFSVTPNPNPYLLYSSDSVGTYIEKLGEGYPAGFDFMIEYARDATQGILRYFNIYCPFKGVAVDQPMTERNGISEFTYDESATDIIGRVTEIGGIPNASGTVPVILRANSSALTNGLIPMVESIINRSDVQDPAPTIGDAIAGVYGGPNVTLNFRGAYNAGTTYAAYDSVSYNNNQYWAKSAVSGTTPASGGTFWGLLPSPLGLQALGDLFLHTWPTRTYTVTYTPNQSLPFMFCKPGDNVNLTLAADNFVINAQKRMVQAVIHLDQQGEYIVMSFNEKAGAK
ncbi:MAG: hypothetical protein M3O41_09380 [Pseudomonadota bacterium]|nr:hypothetical protein [Pseudomonadota bacterium]